MSSIDSTAKLPKKTQLKSISKTKPLVHTKKPNPQPPKPNNPDVKTDEGRQERKNLQPVMKVTHFD